MGWSPSLIGSVVFNAKILGGWGSLGLQYYVRRQYPHSRTQLEKTYSDPAYDLDALVVLIDWGMDVGHLCVVRRLYQISKQHKSEHITHVPVRHPGSSARGVHGDCSVGRLLFV